MNWKQWLLALSLTVAATLSNADVIANADLKNPQREDVIRAFTGKMKQWGTGENVVVYILPREHIATRNFAFNVLSITPSAFDDLQQTARANSQRNPGRVLETESQMLRMVATTIGAVGYMDNIILINQGGGYVKTLPIR